MTTIGSLNYKIGADTSEFVKGAAMTKKEINTIQRVFYATATEAEKVNSAVARLSRGFAAGAIDQQTYAEAVNRVRANTTEVREAEKRRADMERQAAAIRQRNLTDEERYAEALERTKRELTQLVAAGKLSRGDAANELRRVKSTNPAELARQAAMQRTAAEAAKKQEDDDNRRRARRQQVGSAIIDRSGLGNFVAMAAGALTVAAAYNTLRNAVAGVSERMTAIDEMSKKAATIGVDLRELQQLQYAAGLDAGLDAEQTGEAFQKLQKGIAETNQGVGRSKLAFEALGLDITDLQNAGPVDALAMVADGMAKVESQSDKAWIASKLFGDQAAAMSLLLSQGGDKLREYSAEFDQLGLGLSTIDAQQVEIANDEMSKLGSQIENAKDHIVVGLAPAIRVANDYLMELAASSGTNGQSIVQWTEQATIGAVGAAARFRDWFDVLAGWTTGDMSQFGAGVTGENENAAIDRMLEKLDEVNRAKREAARLDGLMADLQANPEEALARIAAEETRLRRQIDQLNSEKDSAGSPEELAATEKLIADKEAALATLEAAQSESEKISLAAKNKEQEALTNKINGRTDALEKEIATLKEEGDAYEAAALKAKGASDLQIQELQTLQAERDKLKAQKEEEQKVAEANKRVDEEIADLQRQAGGEEAEREYQLQQGISEEKLKQVDALKQQIKDQEAVAEASKKLIAESEQVIESLKGPEEKMLEEIDQLQAMYKQGLLTKDQMFAAGEGIISRNMGGGTIAPSSISLGSSEAYKQQVEMQQKALSKDAVQSETERLLGINIEQLDEQRRTREAIEALAVGV
jgi:hypothetical protein